MIGIRGTREAFEINDIWNNGWIRSGEKIADGLTRTGRCKALEI